MLVICLLGVGSDGIKLIWEKFFGKKEKDKKEKKDKKARITYTTTYSYTNT